MPETADLLLRPGTPEDGPAMYANLWRNPEVFRFLFSRPSPDEAAGQPIGIAGVKPLSPARWTITDVAIGPAFQGKGYGTQIIRALVDLAFSRGAQEIAYECFAENEASRRLAQDCGFRFDHFAPAELPRNGQPVTLAHYLLCREG